MGQHHAIRFRAGYHQQQGLYKSSKYSQALQCDVSPHQQCSIFLQEDLWLQGNGTHQCRNCTLICQLSQIGLVSAAGHHLLQYLQA
jgi:hypothetical protein